MKFELFDFLIGLNIQTTIKQRNLTCINKIVNATLKIMGEFFLMKFECHQL